MLDELKAWSYRAPWSKACTSGL